MPRILVKNAADIITLIAEHCPITDFARAHRLFEKEVSVCGHKQFDLNWIGIPGRFFNDGTRGFQPHVAIQGDRDAEDRINAALVVVFEGRCINPWS